MSLSDRIIDSTVKWTRIMSHTVCMYVWIYVWRLCIYYKNVQMNIIDNLGDWGRYPPPLPPPYSQHHLPSIPHPLPQLSSPPSILPTTTIVDNTCLISHWLVHENRPIGCRKSIWEVCFISQCSSLITQKMAALTDRIMTNLEVLLSIDNSK